MKVARITSSIMRLTLERTLMNIYDLQKQCRLKEEARRFECNSTLRHRLLNTIKHYAYEIKDHHESKH
jgi:hypothetical protein